MGDRKPRVIHSFDYSIFQRLYGTQGSNFKPRILPPHHAVGFPSIFVPYPDFRRCRACNRGYHLPPTGVGSCIWLAHGEQVYNNIIITLARGEITLQGTVVVGEF